MVINAIGATATGIVAMVIILAKFVHGAWIVVVLVPLFVLLFKAISRHYASARRQVAELKVNDLRTWRQVMVVPIAQLDHVALRTIAYAHALADDVIVVHIATSADDTATLRAAWSEWQRQQEDLEASETAEKPPQRGEDGAGGAASARTPATIPVMTPASANTARGATPPRLVVIESPYRSLTPPLLAYVDALRDLHADAVITVVLPEFVPAHWWERALHNQTALRLKLALYSHRNVAVANVPYHLH